MPKRDMRSRLAASLKQEEQAVEERFQRAEEKMSAAPTLPPAPQPSPKADRVIRDTFSMPGDDYGAIKRIQERAIAASTPTTKSEVVRAGLRLLESLPDRQLVKALTSLEKIKTGRPAKD